MEKKFGNLFSLIRDDSEAGRYYASLPDYVREEISRRSASVNTFENLRDYAENLTREDE